MPKMPVTASMAPSNPSTPSATVATRAANRAESISCGQGRMARAMPGSKPCSGACERRGLSPAGRAQSGQRATCRCRRAAAEREVHRRLLFFGHSAVFAVLDHAYDLRTVSIPEFEVRTDGILHRSEDFDCEGLLISATVGAFLSSCIASPGLRAALCLQPANSQARCCSSSRRRRRCWIGSR